MPEKGTKPACVLCHLVCFPGMVVPGDGPSPGLLAELPAVSQRKEEELRKEEEELTLYQLPRTHNVPKTSAYTGMLSSRHASHAW